MRSGEMVTLWMISGRIGCVSQQDWNIFGRTPLNRAATWISTDTIFMCRNTIGRIIAIIIYSTMLQLLQKIRFSNKWPRGVLIESWNHLEISYKYLSVWSWKFRKRRWSTKWFAIIYLHFDRQQCTHVCRLWPMQKWRSWQQAICTEASNKLLEYIFSIHEIKINWIKQEKNLQFSTSWYKQIHTHAAIWIEYGSRQPKPVPCLSWSLCRMTT